MNVTISPEVALEEARAEADRFRSHSLLLRQAVAEAQSLLKDQSSKIEDLTKQVAEMRERLDALVPADDETAAEQEG